MQRILPVLSAVAVLCLLIQVMLVAQERTKKPPMKWVLDAPKPAKANYDDKKDELIIDGPSHFYSPKTPPYKFEMTCLYLVGNGMKSLNATKGSDTARITARHNVKFTSLKLVPDKDYPAKKVVAERYDGTAELVVCETGIYPPTKTQAHLVRILEAKDSKGNVVTPKVVKSTTDKDGNPLKGEDPVTINAPEIVFNLDTGAYSADAGFILESTDE